MVNNNAKKSIIGCSIITVFLVLFALLTMFFNRSEGSKELYLGDNANCCLDSSLCAHWVPDDSCKDCGLRCERRKDISNTTPSPENNTTSDNNSSQNSGGNPVTNSTPSSNNSTPNNGSNPITNNIPSSNNSTSNNGSNSITNNIPSGNNSTNQPSTTLGQCINNCILTGKSYNICRTDCISSNNNQSSSSQNNNQTNNGNDTNQQQEETKNCYVRRGIGTNNEYCYGTSELCSGFSEVVTDKTEYNCNENDACYEKVDGTYALGKFDKQSGYQYYGMSCPACYEKENGEYYWTNTPVTNEKVISGINTSDKCITPSKSSLSNNKIALIGLIVVVAVAFFIVLKSLKNNK